MRKSVNLNSSSSTTMEYAVTNDRNDKNLLFENGSSRSSGFCPVLEFAQHFVCQIFNQVRSKYQQKSKKSI